MDEDTGSIPVSHELLHLESSVSPPGLPLKSLLITKGAKKAFAAPEPVKISRVDTSTILNRAKTFLDQVKESNPKEDEETTCDLVSETKDSQESDDEKQQEVEVNFLLYPKTACKTGSNLDKVTQLLEGEDKDCEESSSDTDESESDSSDQESDDSSHGDRRRELSGGKVSQLKHPRVCLEVTESCEDKGQSSSS